MERQGEAIQEYSKSLKLDEKFYKAAYARAACYNRVGQFEEAIDDYEAAIQSDSREKEAGVPRQALTTLFDYE